MKTLLWIVVGLVALVVLLAVAGAFLIDGAVVQAVERGGTYALGVETELASADLGLFSGELELEGLSVRNPEGFERPNFLELGQGRLALDMGTLRSDVVRVSEVVLSDIDLDLERGARGTNYGPILESLERFQTDEPPAREEEGKKFLVDRIAIQGLTASVNFLAQMGEAGRVTVEVPEVVLEDVGSAEGGATPSQIIAALVEGLLAATIEAGQGQLPAELLADLEGRLADVRDAAEAIVGDAVRDAEGQVEDLRREVEKGVGETLESLEKQAEGLGGILKRPGQEPKPIETDEKP